MKILREENQHCRFYMYVYTDKQIIYAIDSTKNDFACLYI
jgi:hypothetical protein